MSVERRCGLHEFQPQSTQRQHPRSNIQDPEGIQVPSPKPVAIEFATRLLSFDAWMLVFSGGWMLIVEGCLCVLCGKAGLSRRVEESSYYDLPLPVNLPGCSQRQQISY